MLPLQASALVETLTALIEQPEVHEGLLLAQQFFLDYYEPAPLTQEEMIHEIEMNLSRRAYEQSKAINYVYGGPPISYLYNLGFALGIIGQGLAYARSSEQEIEPALS